MGLPAGHDASTTRSPSTAAIDLAAATDAARKKLTLRRWYGFLRMQGKVARQAAQDPHRLGVLAPRHRHATSASTRRRIAGDPARRGRRCSCRRPSRGCPGRIVAMASADAPMKGIATLLEAFAKLRTERDVELVLVTKPEPGGPHRAADRASSAIGEHVTLRQRHQRRRAGRGDGLGRGRLRAVALRGLLAADRRADGLRDPAGGQPRRRDPRGRRSRRRVRRPGHARATSASSSRRSQRCSTTPSAARGWARPGASGCWSGSAGARWPRPPPRRTSDVDRGAPTRRRQHADR